jgi:hypothetical protein
MQSRAVNGGQTRTTRQEVELAAALAVMLAAVASVSLRSLYESL